MSTGKNKNVLKRDIVVGSRRFSNYFWTFILFLGGLGFKLTGISSYLQNNFLFFINSTELSFLPQGLVMTFYGVVAKCFKYRSSAFCQAPRANTITHDTVGGVVYNVPR